MIEKVEIQYFRSIYRVTIANLNKINVFCGKMMRENQMY